MKSSFKLFIICVALSVFLISCNYSSGKTVNSSDNLSETDTSSHSETFQENEQNEISISIYSLSAYNELFDAVDYTDEELDKFLNTYPECYAYCGITNREELLAFVKLLEAAPLPTITDESLIESFYLEYRTGQNMFDMIYKLGGNRYRFCVWAKSNTFSDSIFADSNATIVSTHMLGNIQIDLYSKGTENVYYDSFELSSYKVEVLAYDDTNNVTFDFSNFNIDT